MENSFAPENGAYVLIIDEVYIPGEFKTRNN
jgi:hypothetical protein